MLELIFFSIILLASFYLLAIICEEYFVISLDQISKKLKLSSDVAGATFMALQNYLPLFLRYLNLVIMQILAQGQSLDLRFLIF